MKVLVVDDDVVSRMVLMHLVDACGPFDIIEAEDGEVADIELDDLVTLVLHLARLVQGRPADFIADVVKLVRFQNRSQN